MDASRYIYIGRFYGGPVSNFGIYIAFSLSLYIAVYWRFSAGLNFRAGEM